MAIINDNGGLVMPVAPAYGGGYGGGLGGGGDWWGILLLIALLNGGMFGGLGGWGGMGGMMGLGIDFPWLMNGQQQLATGMNSGFRDAQLSDSMTSIRDSIASLAAQLCECCGSMREAIGGVNLNIAQTGNGIAGAVRDGFYSAEIAAAGRQTANMQQLFGLQSTMQNGFCDNRAGIENLRFTVAQENCLDRQVVSDVARDIIANQTAGFQSIKDMFRQGQLDAKNDEIAQLRQEVLFARGQASQIAQNQTIVDNIYNRLSTCPVDTVPVFGNQRIFSCGNNGGCGNAFVN